MRIAVDVRPLSSHLTGIGRYTHSILKRLIESNHDWFLYSDRPLTSEILPRSNVTIRTGQNAGRSLGSLRWAQRKFLKWAKQDNVDVFWSPRHHLPLLLPKQIKKVLTIHDLVWKRYPETMHWKNYLLERLLMGPSIHVSDRLIAVSKFTSSEISHFYPKAADKTTVIYEAAESAYGVPCLPEGVPKEYILFVGTLEPRKNLNTLLSAYARQRQHTRLPRLVIAGGQGWGKIQLDQLISSLGLDEHVRVLGYVTNEQLESLYHHANCLVMPSLYEGFGLPLLEAMRHGVPLLTSNSGSMAEITGSAALLVNPNSLESIGAALAKITGDVKIRKQLSAAAVQQARKFSWDKSANETLSLLESL